MPWPCRALQLALLNENFTRKAAWTPKQQVSESDASDNEKATARSFSWKVSRRNISRRDSYMSAQGEASTSGVSTSEARETTDDSTDSRNSQTQFQRKLK